MNETYRLGTTFVQTVLIGALSFFGQEIGGAEPNQRKVKTSVPAAAATLSDAFRTAANRASRGLVTIYTLRGPRMTAPWRRREAANNACSAIGSAEDLQDEQGSGIVFDRQGLILTCNHVVASADVVFVVLSDGQKYEAIDVRGDPTTDLAVIRIEGAGELDEVQLGDSESTKVGDWVVSLANPYELKQSVSAGIVSATDRWVPGTPHPLIQNDAATNPGSSGGALLNLQGEVVGVITGGFSTGKGFQGIGLAIPVNTAKQTIDKLGESTPTQREYFGCETQKLSPAIAQQLGLPVAGGLYVKDVEKGSHAARAGIEQGDIITHFTGQAIDDTFQPEQLFEEPIPNNNYTFLLFRDERSVAVDVQMGHLSGRNNIVTTRAKMHSTHSSEHFDDILGLGLDKLTIDDARQLEFPKDIQGVLVTDVTGGGIAYKEGISAGMVILRVNSHVIHDLDDYRQATSASSLEKPVLILLQSNEGKHLAIFER